MRDFVLRYKLVDRGGQMVYDVYNQKPDFALIESGEPTGDLIGELRLKPLAQTGPHKVEGQWTPAIKEEEETCDDSTT